MCLWRAQGQFKTDALENVWVLLRIVFSIVKYKYSSSVSTCVAPLKVLLNSVKCISRANSTQRMTVREQHAEPEGFPSSGQKKPVKCLQTVRVLPQQQVAISIQASRLNEVP